MSLKRLLLGIFSFVLFCYFICIIKLPTFFSTSDLPYITLLFILSALFYGIFAVSVCDLNRNYKVILLILALLISGIVIYIFHPSIFQIALILSGALTGTYKHFHKVLPALAVVFYFLLICRSTISLSYYVQNNVVAWMINYSKPILHQYFEMNYHSIANQQKEEILKGYNIATAIVIKYASNISDRNITQLSSTLLQIRKELSSKIDLEIEKNKEKAIEEMEKTMYNNIYSLSAKYWKYILLLYLAIIYSAFSLFSSVAQIFFELFKKLFEKKGIN